MTLSINFDDEKVKTLIKAHFCKGADNELLMLFAEICKRTNLDPFRNEIYAVVRNDNKSGKKVLTTIVSINALRSMAEDTGCYAPGRKTEYNYDVAGNLISATAYVKKLTPDGTWHEYGEEARLSEYKPKHASAFWSDMPHIMLAKCSEAASLRRAFPKKFSGLYVKEEMEQAAKTEEDAKNMDVDLYDVEVEAIDLNKEVEKFIDEKAAKYDRETVKTLLNKVLEKRNKAPGVTPISLYELVIDYKNNGKFDDNMKLFIERAQNVKAA